MKTAMTIAGSDSSGGAGIQADLKVFAALGIYGTSAITAVTAQNTRGVEAVEKISPDMVARQIKAVLSDVGADAVKLGMLVDAESIEAVACAIDGVKQLVIDPVMISKSGHSLLARDAVVALRERLFPHATVITPNLPEAAALLGVSQIDDLEQDSLKLLQMTSGAILLKGGHSADVKFARDLLTLPSGEQHWLSAPRIETRNTHGTGCTLSAALTAFLAKGFDVVQATKMAKEFLTRALEDSRGAVLGSGHGPAFVVQNRWSTLYQS